MVAQKGITQQSVARAGFNQNDTAVCDLVGRALEYAISKIVQDPFTVHDWKTVRTRISCTGASHPPKYIEPAE